MAECDRTSADSARALRLHALWAEQRGHWADAVAKWLECIEREPAILAGYEHALQCSARLAEADRRRAWNEMSRALLTVQGRLSVARPMMALVVERFGLEEAEREVERWRSARPDDPDALEAAADLLIEHGHGLADVRRALGMLTTAVERFPYHPGLRFSLSNAHRVTGEPAEAEKALLEILRRHPANTAAHIQLARVKQAGGDSDGAGRALDTAQASDPHNPDVASARAQLLIAGGLHREARRCVEDGLARMPRNVSWRYHATTLLMQCGAHDQAAAAAREGVVIYPHGAFLWFVLAKTLAEMRRYAATGEIASCYRRSLALNPGLMGAAEGLAMWLTEQERYEEAVGVLRDIEPTLADPSRVRGLRAWIGHREGRKDEALREMIAVVESAPWFRFGWTVLAKWIEEDEAWGEARRILGEAPAVMATDGAFRKHRLVVLRKAGVDRVRLQAEWADLARVFPDDPSLREAMPDPARQDPLPRTVSMATSNTAFWVWWVAAFALLRLLMWLLDSM